MGDKLLRVREFDTITCNDDYKNEYKYLSEDVFENVEQFIREYTSSDGGAEALDFLKVGYRKRVGKTISVNNYVGLIEVKGGHQIEVLPKIDFSDDFSNVEDTDAETKRIFLKMLKTMKDFPGKSFNMAGLGSSVCYCPNTSLRNRFFGYLDGYEVAGGNIFAYVGAEAAFTHGEEWLKQMLRYLEGNVAFLRDYLSANLPQVKAVLPEASYLAWLDFSDMGFQHDELKDRFLNRARVAMNDGTTFGGNNYRCRFRLNLGCPRSVLEVCLNRICDALK